MIELDFQCDEPESSLEPREAGPYCRRCREGIVDLSLLTRKQALVVIREGERCVQFRRDASGEPIFRREPSPLAPLGAAALTLLAACGPSETPQASSPVPVPAVAPSENAPTTLAAPTPEPIHAASPIVPEPTPAPPTTIAAAEPTEKPALDYSQLPPDPGDCSRGSGAGVTRRRELGDPHPVMRGRIAPRPEDRRRRGPVVVH